MEGGGFSSFQSQLWAQRVENFAVKRFPVLIKIFAHQTSPHFAELLTFSHQSFHHSSPLFSTVQLSWRIIHGVQIKSRLFWGYVKSVTNGGIRCWESFDPLFFLYLYITCEICMSKMSKIDRCVAFGWRFFNWPLPITATKDNDKK